MKKLLTMMMALGLMTATPMQAQEGPKLEVKPSGRILFDAAYLNPQHQEDELKSGVGIPDVRVGVGFSYGQWKGKIDMGYAYGKVGMKDVWLQYNFNKQNFLRGGYFIHQYGYQSCTSSSFKETMEEPQSNAMTRTPVSSQTTSRATDWSTIISTGTPPRATSLASSISEAKAA